MKCSEAIADWKQRNETGMRLLIEKTHPLTEERLELVVNPGVWSAAQEVEHLIMANRHYLQVMERTLATGIHAADAQMHFSLIGRILIWAAGPKGNTPAPSFLEPSKDPHWAAVLEELQTQSQSFQVLLDRSAGIDLSHTKMKNPFASFIKMSLADAYESMAAHLERHVGQIVSRL